MLIDMHQLYISCILILLIFVNLSKALLQSDRKSSFLNNEKMFSKDAFPEQTFDETAPVCTFDREPCGFYSFSMNGNLAFKWVKSWCRCDVDQECAFDRMDMRMRVFRHTCVSTNRTNGSKLNGDLSRRKHRHRRQHHHE